MIAASPPLELQTADPGATSGTSPVPPPAIRIGKLPFLIEKLSTRRGLAYNSAEFVVFLAQNLH